MILRPGPRGFDCHVGLAHVRLRRMPRVQADRQMWSRETGDPASWFERSGLWTLPRSSLPVSLEVLPVARKSVRGRGISSVGGLKLALRIQDSVARLGCNQGGVWPSSRTVSMWLLGWLSEDLLLMVHRKRMNLDPSPGSRPTWPQVRREGLVDRMVLLPFLLVPALTLGRSSGDTLQPPWPACGGCQLLCERFRLYDAGSASWRVGAWGSEGMEETRGLGWLSG